MARNTNLVSSIPKREDKCVALSSQYHIINSNLFGQSDDIHFTYSTIVTVDSVLTTPFAKQVGIITNPATKVVVARAALKGVVAGVSIEGVVAIATAHGVVSVTAVEIVVARATIEGVITCLAVQDVIPALAVDGVGVECAHEAVCPVRACVQLGLDGGQVPGGAISEFDLL